MYKLLLLIILGFVVYTCVSAPPTQLSPAGQESVVMNVWVHFPNVEKDTHIGRVQGLAACTRTAFNYAASVGWGNSKEWTYYCCTVEGGSECYRKMR